MTRHLLPAPKAVATGRLSEAGAAELTAREAARRAVLDYAAAQAAQRAEINESIATSERNLAILHSTVKALLLADGAEPVGSSPAELAAYLRTELAKWGKVVRDNNIIIE